MEPVITAVRENIAIVAVLGVLLFPILYLLQQKAMAFLFHTIEYIVYVTLMHYMLYAMVQVAAWYKQSTAMTVVEEGEQADAPFNTPAGIISQNFFDSSLYNPAWLFYFEGIMCLALLYLVVVVRPTSYSGANSFKGDKDRGMKPQPGGARRAAGRGRYDRSRAQTGRGKRS